MVGGTLLCDMRGWLTWASGVAGKRKLAIRKSHVNTQAPISLIQEAATNVKARLCWGRLRDQPNSGPCQWKDETLLSFSLRVNIQFPEMTRLLVREESKRVFVPLALHVRLCDRWAQAPSNDLSMSAKVAERILGQDLHLDVMNTGYTVALWPSGWSRILPFPAQLKGWYDGCLWKFYGGSWECPQRCEQLHPDLSAAETVYSSSLGLNRSGLGQGWSYFCWEGSGMLSI